ncbi:MAG TPA: holo-ACP synthase [Polyangia bacterium]|nr:holo-ACP synthase [Polyangia bacterium]
MIIGVGLDIVPIERMAATLARHGLRIEGRLFTEAERAYCTARGSPAQHFAARFAAKEALLKALGAPPGLRWREMEVVAGANGAPALRLDGEAARAAAARGVATMHVSLTHAGGMAAAVVVLEAAP